jgi:NTE family protein
MIKKAPKETTIPVAPHQAKEAKIPEFYHLPKNCKREVIYVFQGGGALGSYQVGAFEALAEHGYTPDTLIGISIGAINAAIIAGNLPDKRKQKLYEFWDKITTKMPFPMKANLGLAKFHNWVSASMSLTMGQNGFFVPKMIDPVTFMDATPDQISYYDTTPLRETLLELIDFDYLNKGKIRLCMGSVDLESGEFVFFDNTQTKITPEHIMASCALPPGFPPIKIGERYYIDGGVFSNTPLSKVIDDFATTEKDVKNILCFMIDLFPLRGPLPHSMDGLMERVKDIRYSSHAKRANALYATTQNLSHAIHFLTSKMTDAQLKDKAVQDIIKLGYAHRLDIIHLIYRSEKGTELASKDYEFSEESAIKHRKQGYINTMNMIEAEEKEWLKVHDTGVTVYTLEPQMAVSHKI